VKLLGSQRILTASAVIALIAGCTNQGNFARFLANEIGSFGGRTNVLAGAAMVSGSWDVKRDQFGAAINAVGIRFETVTNLLTTAYGEPKFYSPANDRHGPTFLYPPTNAGVCIFVSGTETGAEVTLTRLPDKRP